MECDGYGIRQGVSDIDLLLSRRDAKGGWLRLWISAYCFTIIIYGISNLIELYAELKQLRVGFRFQHPPLQVLSVLHRLGRRWRYLL